MKSNLRGLINTVAVVLTITSVAFFKCSGDKKIDKLKYDLQIANQNLKASEDSIRITKDRLGRSEADKLSYIITNNNLKHINTELVSELKATKGKVIALQKAGVKIIEKSVEVPVYVDSSKYRDSGIVALGLNLDTTYSKGNYRKIRGVIELSKKIRAEIETELGVSLVTGLKKNEKNDYEIFLRSDYPGLVITELQGAYIPGNQLNPPKKKRHFSFGVQVGFSPVSYELDTRKLKLKNQITAGVGVNYKF